MTSANYNSNQSTFLISEDKQKLTDLDPPHTNFRLTICLLSVKTLSVETIYWGKNSLTFDINSLVVSELVWLELDRNLGKASVE